MEKHTLSVPYKGTEYDVSIVIDHQHGECRIKARVSGLELLFVSREDDCLQAVYRENIIDTGLIDEITRRICKECL